MRSWSAACAGGREPYSLAMLAHDDPEIDESAVEVLGTDISEPALETIERSLRPKGYLVIGKSETISSRLQSTFFIHDSQLRIYRNRPDST
ncbi:hypothetical protein HALLA_09335 [Halostagnicola larsenii XH-48]|uniref:CheR-type methyltransferase domain-containing protein n=1 Tax=Halostagnicola larsenii XH-48 TaxID=797299 RepID=W0JQF9_9EURY|nr:hypothetical protein HALLA_09335 [Halostagnicola larsenii XH-48]